MLDVGFGELFCFGIITLLVLGPDKLPVAARFAGRWYARLKRYLSNIQHEINRELKISEFRKEMQDELHRIETLERKIQSQLEEIEKRKFYELAQHPQNHRQNQHIVRVYSFTSTAICIPFTTWQSQESTDKIIAPPQQPASIELSIAV